MTKPKNEQSLEQDTETQIPVMPEEQTIPTPPLTEPNSEGIEGEAETTKQEKEGEEITKTETATEINKTEEETQKELPTLEEEKLSAKVEVKPGAELPPLKTGKSYYYKDQSGNPRIIHIAARDGDKLTVRFEKLTPTDKGNWQLAPDPEDNQEYQIDHEDLAPRLRARISQAKLDPETLEREFEQKEKEYNIDSKRKSQPRSSFSVSPIQTLSAAQQKGEQRKQEPKPRKQTKETKKKAEKIYQRTSTGEKTQESTREKQSEFPATETREIELAESDPLLKWAQEKLGSKDLKVELMPAKEKKERIVLISGGIYKDKHSDTYYIVQTVYPFPFSTSECIYDNEEKKWKIRKSQIPAGDFLKLIRSGDIEIIKPDKGESPAQKVPKKLRENRYFANHYLLAIAQRAASKEFKGSRNEGEKRAKERRQKIVALKNMLINGMRQGFIWEKMQTGEKFILEKLTPTRVKLRNAETGEELFLSNPTFFLMNYDPVERRQEKKTQETAPEKKQTEEKIEKQPQEQPEEIENQPSEEQPQEQTEETAQEQAETKPSDNTPETFQITKQLPTKPYFREPPFESNPEEPSSNPYTNIFLENAQNYIGEQILPEQARTLKIGEIIFRGEVRDNTISGRYAKISGITDEGIRYRLINSDNNFGPKEPKKLSRKKEREIAFSEIASSEEEAENQNKYLLYRVNLG